MKIITITTNGFSKAFSSWPELVEARGLHQRGHSVQAYTYRGTRDFNSAKQEWIDGIKVKRLWRRQFLVPGLLPALLLGKRPDIVHLHHWSGQFNWLATLLCKVRCVPVVLTTYGLFHDHYLVPDRDRPYDQPPRYDELIYDWRTALRTLIKTKKFKYVLRNYFTHAPYRWVDRLIVLSEHEKGIAKILGVDPAKVAIIPVSIDESWLNGAKPAPKVGQSQILYLGQLKYRKGFDLLARALPQVFAALPDARCIIASHSPIRLPELLKILEEGGVRDKVIYRDDVSDAEKASIFLSSDAYILPTRYESFGIPLIEAMSAGCAVVSSEIPVITELIHANENGVLAPLDDIDGLAAAIINLLSNPTLHQQVVEQGKKTVQAYYTPVVMERLEKVYQEVIAEKSFKLW
jgi:glycosyltransferase involved in cell wall biosynthesis